MGKERRSVVAEPAQAASAVPNTEIDVEPPTSLDRVTQAVLARTTLGISPASLALAGFDWLAHLAMSPGKWQRLAEKSVRKWARLASYLPRACSGTIEAPCIEPLERDERFRDDAWKRWPFNIYSQAFLLQQQWWHNATTGIPGVSAHHEAVVSFVARQLLDMVSPVNFVATNPAVLDATLREQGQNLLRGAGNLHEDWERAVSGKPPVGAEQFQPGKAVAVTPGKVVYRNRLIELIQYAPTTDEVAAEPVLIVPAWIMKYYILDLSPQNSLVRYLVERGHTVFMVSWHNPSHGDRDLDMDDYLRLGVLDALKAVRTIVPGCKVDTVGYCLGGTLLAIATAYLARERDPVVHSMTLLAAQTDFTEAGELMLFIDPSQLDYLENLMWDQGYLDTKQMSGAFQLLRSNDLIWSQVVQQYLMGKRTPMTDLMAWNADATRMPYRMHSQYLRRLFLNNELFEGRYEVDGKPVVLRDIQVPIFVVATERDHVAPWRSVYKIKLAADADVAFVLTSGGHNAGIVSEPTHHGRHYRMSIKHRQSTYLDPDNWFAATPQRGGSWWTAWGDWLAEHASGRNSPPGLGALQRGLPVLADAPGCYVFER
ncbi:MAG: polyhydroxyalkanoic acid synthase [Burkholderiales bacterium]|nr:polyhydroxyalkanoic acid synthase [Burkholderiales bacterium]